MTQHAELSAERWSTFDLGQQILQIGVELFRSERFLKPGTMDGLRRGYERVLRLVDLTVQVQVGQSLRKELLRWRDVIAELYVGEAPDPETHRLALRTLLQLHPVSAQQIEILGL